MDVWTFNVIVSALSKRAFTALPELEAGPLGRLVRRKGCGRFLGGSHKGARLATVVLVPVVVPVVVIVRLLRRGGCWGRQRPSIHGLLPLVLVRVVDVQVIVHAVVLWLLLLLL